MLKDFLIKTKLGEKKIKNISGLQGPDGPKARHSLCNADWPLPGPRLKPSAPAQHDPFYYRAVHGLWVGRHEPG
jgi:hypothetical protein